MPLTRTLPGAGNMQVSGQGNYARIARRLSAVRRKVRDVETTLQADHAAKMLRLAGTSFREASRRVARCGYVWAVALHSSHEVVTEPGEAMLVCRMCRPVTAWPCTHYEAAESGRAEVEAEWARQDLAAGR